MFSASTGDIHETLIFNACESQSFNCYAYYTAEYIKDLGSPSRWKSLWNKSTQSLITASSREYTSGAIFVDKDDTIVKDELSVLPGKFEFIPIEDVSLNSQFKMNEFLNSNNNQANGENQENIKKTKKKN